MPQFDTYKKSLDSPHGEQNGHSLPDAPTPAGLGKHGRATGESGDKAHPNKRSDLTKNQLQVWIGQRLLPEAPVYHLAGALKIRGQIDPLHFQKAFQTLINSSDALRTVIEETDGLPIQKVIQDFPYSMDYLDFSLLPDSQEAIKTWMRERCQVPFDLQQRLFDSALIKISAKEYVWYLNLHHFIGDGWSFKLIYRFMADLYQRSLQGRLTETVELFRFQDYVDYEREYRDSPRYRKTEAYWKQQLADSIEPISFYGKTPIKQTTKVRRITCDLGLQRSKKLKALAAQEGPPGDTEDASLFNTFCALLATYLHHLNGNESCSIGIPFHNRRLKSFKETIGFFSEVLPLRITIADNETFPSLIGKIKTKIFETIRHGQFAVANPHHKKAYDVILNYHMGSFSHFNGMPAVAQWIHTGHGEESLALQVHDFGSSGALVLDFDFHCDVFTHEQSEQAVNHFLQVLDAFLTDCTQPLHQVSLLLPDEKQRILFEWNKTSTDYPRDQCIHQLFEEQVERTPGATAVVFPSTKLRTGPSTGSGHSEDKRLTYQELNQRANQLAHYLRSLGVGPEVLVGIYMERSLEMVVALLGILKAGGAYVPLDPNSPKERLALMLEDTQAPVLLTQKKLMERLPDVTVLQNSNSKIRNRNVVCLDTDWGMIAQGTEENPGSEMTAGNLAYVIYTSGSTGRPKGVEITHRALVNFTTSARAAFALEPIDRVLQFAPISFDTAAEEIFPCLIQGGTLVLRTDSMLDSVSTFLQKCRELEVTVLDLPTVYWHELTAKLSSEHLAIPEQIRLVIIGGERALPERLAQWQQCVDRHVRLLNTYGPTEATVVATMYKLNGTGEVGVSLREVPIGRPIANVQTYVLDKHLNPVPIGVPGELHIGGAGLARGYLNRPELTAEKFITHPFSPVLSPSLVRACPETVEGINSVEGNEPEARLYKTGDLARYLPDGNIEFLGRTDHQVKIRGFRIELGEIEAFLMGHPAVRETVVVAREDELGDPSAPLRTGSRLVAYVVSNQESPPTTNELRCFLKKKLPDYMVPSAFVPLESLPFTPNGKVDRRALPDPSQTRSEMEGTFTAPRTPVEKTLAGIWRDLLELKKVGIHDNFFELGGHSLLATQVISRLHELFNIEIPLRVLFETPTISELAERVQMELRNGHRAMEVPPITAINRERELPLSFSQERMWFLHQLAPESTAYNMAAPLRITGILNKAALERSLNELVRRHESLRTTFHNVGGKPVQVITPAQFVTIKEVDLRMVPEDHRLEEARRLTTEEARHPFDFERGPLMRLLLIQLGEEDHVLQITMHHIISDHWSLGVIGRELALFYNTFCGALPLPTNPLPIQYADFAVWQGQWLRSEVLEAEISYWKKQLADFQVLEIPTDHPRPCVQTFHGAHLILDFPRSLTERLKKLSLKENVTLYMTLLAAFKTLLHRYSGQQDIAIGSPIANRNKLAIEGIIGTFVNVLVLRTDLSGNPTFRELLARVREVALGAYAHQDMPFEKLVEELQPERDMSRSPLVQVLFNLHNTPIREVSLSDLSWTPFEIDIGTSQFDISLSIDTEITNKIILTYNTDLYGGATIDRMLRHYLRLLEAIVTEPEAQISRLELLSEAEQREALLEWNDTASDYPRGACLPDLIEAQVERTPEAIAAIMEDDFLSYRELNSRANQLAWWLRSLGVGPDVRVAICMERSLEMLVGLLGILKAGGAYVPLDPDYPSKRNSFMLEDSEAVVLLTQKRLLKNFQLSALRPQASHSPTPKVVCLDTDWEMIAQESEENPIHRATAENLAYVIYTSGSTGKPKGVEIPHRALVNFLESMRREPGLTDRDILLSVTTLSFDIAGLELFLPLIVGGRVVLASREVAADGQRLIERLGSTGATVMQATPVTWRMLLQAGWGGNIGLKILCGGELLPHDLAQALLERGNSVWNLYGPTETTIWSTVWKVELGQGPISIGRPIDNTQVYILDNYLQPMPVGMPGEIHIGGDGLARGYLKRPELTAEKFIPNPFSPVLSPSLVRACPETVEGINSVEGNEPGARLYKTGDLARYLPDGNIEYLGRIDQQVKILGIRIELGEIETVLGQHFAVLEAVVMAREDVPGEKRLVAYIVPNKDAPPSFSDLRSFLKEKLPDHMVPSAFAMLDSLPLTPNGKVDRRALPVPDTVKPELEHAFVPPRTPHEELMAGIWAQVLRLMQVGIHDNFFDLGGHSLLATQVISRLRDTLQVELPLRSLFEAPTVAGLTEIVEATGREKQGSLAPPMVPVSRDKNPPLSFAQQRLWFLNLFEPASPAYNIPAAIRLTGPLNIAALEKSLNEILRRHEVLRTTITTSVDGLPVQVIGRSEPFTLSVVDLMEFPDTEREEEAQRLVTEKAQRPFDLAQGPLVRANLLRLSEERHILFLVMHHIVSDGWSSGVLFQEMAILYEAFSTGQVSPLPELPIQYADFAVWQRQWLQGEVFEGQLSYWKQQLSGIPPFLEMPTDRPRPPVQIFRGARQSLQLSPTLTEALKALSRREGVTLFMTLLAAFQTLLHRYTGQDDIVVGSPIANRTRAEIEGLIGFFANTLVLRTDLSGNPSFVDLLDQVRGMALEAYAHQDLPFEKLVEELQPDRHLNHSPLFQVMFILQNAPMSTLEVPGLTLSPMEVDTKTAKLDLTLSMVEGSEGLWGVAEYNTDLFDASTITRILDHFRILLESIVLDPDQGILELPLLTEAERHQLLVEWNDTQTDNSKDSCIHQLFEAQADRTPDAIAVVFEDEQLTYRELNTRANQLAQYLRTLGVRPEVLVGICMDRSSEMVVGLLGILKAGGAYVPLDPNYPKERLVFMLEDARVAVLLTQQRLLNSFQLSALSPQPSHSPTHKVVCLDSDWEVIVQESAENPVNRVAADNLAYVIYTSGSTGIPKGVLGLHRGAVNRFKWMWETYPFEAKEICCQKTSLSFVDSVWEIFGPLLKGVPTVIIADDILKDPYLLVQTLAANHVTRIVLVPSLLRVLLDTFDHLQSRLPKLKVWVTSGEALSIELSQHFLQSMPQSILINLYGSTEVSADSTWYDTRNSRSLPCVPIGRPIANTQIYLLDFHLQPVPVGIPGELYIGGGGVARGYLNRPELTAEKFVPNPFSPVPSEVEGDGPGARLYKTGDLARYLPDGNIEFLGRLDHQVKIQGFRIELGEIEAVLGQHRAVQEVIVLAREDLWNAECELRIADWETKISNSELQIPKSVEKHLVTYVVANQQPAPSSSELRNFLKKKLPDYMVPSTFVLVDALPLTPNGKVDCQALPAPDHARREPEETFVAPHDTLEFQLVKIWEKALDIKPIGMKDNFFELGGHSLLAVHVLAQIEKVIGKHLPVATLFEAPTIEQLAGILRLKGWSPPWSFLVPLQPAGSKTPFFCLHGTTAMTSCVDLDQPFYGLLPHGLDGRQATSSVEDMAADYIRDIRALQPEGPYFLGGYSFGGILAFETAQQLRRQGQEVALLVLIDPTRPNKGKLVTAISQSFPMLLQNVKQFRFEAYRNLNNLASLGLQEKLLYVLKRVRGKIRRIMRDVLLRRAKIIICNLYLRFGRRVPPNLRRFYSKSNCQARREYMPQVYPGDLILLRSKERSDNGRLDWRELVAGSLEIHDLPGNHNAVSVGPYVQVWSEKIRDCLDKAQEATSGK